MGDRWSYYIAPENYQALQDRRANRYVGIGVTVDYSDERGLLIREVTAGSPAEQSGITAGELITAVDGQSVAGDARYEGVALIGGGEGTEQTLTVLGENGQEREVVLILAQKEDKLAIMQEIGRQCGMKSKAQGIVMSLPVDSIAGLD